MPGNGGLALPSEWYKFLARPTQFEWVRRIISGRQEVSQFSMSKPNNILIYRIGSLGDTVVALPCFHLIARRFPDSRRILLTNLPVHAKAPAAASVLENSGLVDCVLDYSVGKRNIVQLTKLWWRIRRLRVSTLVYLVPPRGESAAKRDEKFFRSCGVKEIIGTPFGELAHHAYDPVTNRYEAEASRLARCLAPLGDAHLHDPASWDLRLTSQEQARAASVLRPLKGEPFLVLGIASKMSATDWGVENWKRLMPMLQREFPEHAAVFIGAKQDRAVCDQVAARWPGRWMNLSGELSPRDSAAVLRQGDLFLGPDSGPMHLAASVGTVCVAIFSARNRPGLWFPFGNDHQILYHQTECFGCNLEVCSIAMKKCNLSVSAEEVIAAARQTKARHMAMARSQPAEVVEASTS